jgi:hypothetical protein
MLLQEILKYTPKDHEDYEDLNNSLLKVSEVANANNEAIRQREFKDQIMRVMMTIESKSRINLLDEPTRVFKREADMFRQCRLIFLSSFFVLKKYMTLLNPNLNLYYTLFFYN